MFAGVLSQFTDRLAEFSQHWWFLAIVFGIALADSVLPIVPSETCVILGGVAAAQDSYPLPAVIAVGALGAFLGDNASYELGATAGPWLHRRAARRPRTRARLDWATAQLAARGGPLLVTARFIPGGRTALTLASGMTRRPRRWFVAWIAVAALVWAAYGALLGYLGGRAFGDDHTKAFLVAFGGAISVTIVIELVRHLRKRAADPTH